ncbi:MAG: hypothetical protein ACYTER_02910 [Planctomycetota bacterium]|jgi:flagellar biosynthesis chaperone FliJ
MERGKRWRLERGVGVSVLVELVTLAGLIVGSWVNLQRQLDLVSHDVKQLLTAQEKFCEKMEGVQTRVIAHEYRLQTLEKRTTNPD